MSRLATLLRESAAHPPRARVRIAALPLALVVLTGAILLALFALMPQTPQRVVLDVGAEAFRAPDETESIRRIAGFHETEVADGVSFRWTKDWARMTFPHGHHLGDGLELRLRLCGCRPEGPQPDVQVSIDQTPIATLATDGAYRTYTLLLPARGNAFGSDVFLELHTSTTNLDGRAIGVRLDRVKLSGTPSQVLEWPVALLLTLLGMLVALAVLALVRAWPVRLVLAGALLLGPALLLVAYRAQQLTPVSLILAALLGVLLVALARPRELLPALVLSVSTTTLTLLPQLLGGWLVDDAFISFRYAQNLVEGNGLVFNAGERVEGYTNFLWTMLVAAILRLGNDPVYLVQVITLLIAQATLVVCFVVGRTLLDHSRPISSAWHKQLGTLIAPLLLATSGPFLLYSARGSGMETALFTLLLLGGVALYVRSIAPDQQHQRPWSLAGAAGLLALAAMTRPEGVLVFGLTLGHALLRVLSGYDWRRPVVLAGAFLAIYLPYYLWRFSYYGLPLPNTFYVKVGATEAQLLRGMRYLGDYWAATGWAWLIGLSAIAILAATYAARHYATFKAGGTGRAFQASRLTSQVSHFTHPTAYIALIVCTYTAYIAAVGGDWLPGARFVVPIIPLLALLAQAGLVWLAQHGRIGAGLAVVLLAAVLVDQTRAALTTSANDPNNLIWRENDVVSRRREVGRWLHDHTPADTLVAVEAAGALPYYSRRPAIDILGLNDRHIASVEVETLGQGKPGHEKTDIPYVLSRQPDIIPYFSVPYFFGNPDFEQHYTRQDYNGPEGFTVILYWRNEGG